MQTLIVHRLDRDAWMRSLNMDTYSTSQQDQVWSLLSRTVEAKALDAVLDHLPESRQQELVRYLHEEALSDHLPVFLNTHVPDHAALLDGVAAAYQQQVGHDLQALRGRLP